MIKVSQEILKVCLGLKKDRKRENMLRNARFVGGGGIFVDCHIFPFGFGLESEL